MQSKFDLTAKIEPFDTFWEAPEDVEKGFKSFGCFYKSNYLKYLPVEKNSSILVVSCGPGYFVNLLDNFPVCPMLKVRPEREKMYWRKRKFRRGLIPLSGNSNNYSLSVGFFMASENKGMDTSPVHS